MFTQKSLIGLLLVLMLGIVGCGSEDQKEEKNITIDKEHELYKYFTDAYEGKKPLLTGVNDINNDGREDLIVIYQDTSAANKMIAIWEEEGTIAISEPAPAPVENCRLEWKDIDDRDPIELIVSGSKGVNVGYAIYRWENGDFVNVFGESMEDCC